MSRAITVVNGVPRMRDVYASAPSIYDTNTVVGVSGISTGTPITLPSGQTYSYLDLEVMLNGNSLTPGVDWNTVGTIPRTDIAITFDLVSGDQLRFRINVPV